MNSRAKIEIAELGKFDQDKVLNTNLLILTQPLKHLIGLMVLWTLEIEEYGIHSFIYRVRHPFHPQRFYDFVNFDWKRGSPS